MGRHRAMRHTGWVIRAVDIAYFFMGSYGRRRSHHLAEYDYASPGTYFVTLCIHRRLRLLGHILSSRVVLSPAGELVKWMWEKLPERYPGVCVDALMVMPDHVHAVLSLPGGTQALPEIIHAMKSHSTARYAEGVRVDGWPPFDRMLWQPGFFDRVVRNETELQTVIEYVLSNPMRWELREAARKNAQDR